MKLNFQKIFYNPLSKYPISKKYLECIGYISGYLPKLDYAQWVTTSTPHPKIPSSNLTDVLSWDLDLTSLLGSYHDHNCWTRFHVDFLKVRFKYLGPKQRIFFMEDSSNGLFFKLVLMFLKWFACFPKDFGSPVQLDLELLLYSIFMKTPDSN